MAAYRGTTDVDTTTFTDTGKNADGSSIGALQQGQDYRYEVRAIRSNSQLDSDFTLDSQTSFADCPVCAQNQLLEQPTGTAPSSSSSDGASDGGTSQVPVGGITSDFGSNFGDGAVIMADGTGTFRPWNFVEHCAELSEVWICRRFRQWNDRHRRRWIAAFLELRFFRRYYALNGNPYTPQPAPRTPAVACYTVQPHR